MSEELHSARLEETEEIVRDQGIIVFSIHDEEYGIRIEEVREILELTHITPLYQVDHFIKGVTNIRGQVVVLVDIVDFLGMPPLPEVTAGMSAILISCDNREVLVLIEKIKQVLWTTEDFFNVAPATMEEGLSRYIEAIIQEPAATPIALLDVGKILDASEWEKYQ